MSTLFNTLSHVYHQFMSSFRSPGNHILDQHHEINTRLKTIHDRSLQGSDLIDALTQTAGNHRSFQNIRQLFQHCISETESPGAELGSIAEMSRKAHDQMKRVLRGLDLKGYSTLRHASTVYQMVETPLNEKVMSQVSSYLMRQLIQNPSIDIEKVLHFSGLSRVEQQLILTRLIQNLDQARCFSVADQMRMVEFQQNGLSFLRGENPGFGSFITSNMERIQVRVDQISDPDRKSRLKDIMYAAFIKANPSLQSLRTTLRELALKEPYGFENQVKRIFTEFLRSDKIEDGIYLLEAIDKGDLGIFTKELIDSELYHPMVRLTEKMAEQILEMGEDHLNRHALIGIFKAMVSPIISDIPQNFTVVQALAVANVELKQDDDLEMAAALESRKTLFSPLEIS
jgi:hypothetical protein